VGASEPYIHKNFNFDVSIPQDSKNYTFETKKTIKYMQKNRKKMGTLKKKNLKIAFSRIWNTPTGVVEKS
jgi:hypothetical protein